MYPVGSYYISSNSTSPASAFGGTWEQVQGLVDEIPSLSDRIDVLEGYNLNTRMSSMENRLAVFLDAKTGDYSINSTVVNDLTSSDQCQSNTISKWNNFYLNVTTKAAISANTSTTLCTIPASTINVVGETYVVGIGKAGSVIVRTLFDTWEKEEGVVQINSPSAIASGTNIIINMAFPVTVDEEETSSSDSGSQASPSASATVYVWHRIA